MLTKTELLLIQDGIFLGYNGYRCNQRTKNTNALWVQLGIRLYRANVLRFTGMKLTKDERKRTMRALYTASTLGAIK